MMPYLIKFIVILLFIGIFFALGSALFFLIKNGNSANSTNIVKALTWRIALSFLLFVILLIGFMFGWIQPHSI